MMINACSVRCGLKFGPTYRCPCCSAILEEPFLARPVFGDSGGRACQFCLADFWKWGASQIERAID